MACFGAISHTFGSSFLFHIYIFLTKFKRKGIQLEPVVYNQLKFLRIQMIRNIYIYKVAKNNLFKIKYEYFLPLI